MLLTSQSKFAYKIHYPYESYCIGDANAEKHQDHAFVT